ncbi:DUF3168 domain-containing protein [Cupriavidus necator]
MPTIQEQLHSLLSGVASGGIYPMTAAQNAVPPFVVYQRVAGTVENTLAGNGTPPIGNTRFQIDVWAATYAQAVALATSIRALMHGWSVQNVLNLENDDYEPDVMLYRVVLDYSVWHYN